MRLNQRELVSWLDETRALGPPPDLLVERRGRDLVERSIEGLRAMPSFDDLDSGCYSFFIDLSDPERPRRGRSLEARSVAAMIAELAPSVHRRVTVEWREAGSGTDREVNALPPRPDGIDSHIILESGALIPSIGPGGHVFVEERAGTIFGSASVRPFVEAQGASPWSATADLLGELAQFIGEGLEVTPEFGYYESSWMEHQPVIRPTFVFMIHNGIISDIPQKWVVVVPATRGANLLPSFRR